MYIFSVCHNRLFYELKELNNRIATVSRHYRADDSRSLIKTIHIIFDLYETLKNTKYEFKINSLYFDYLSNALNFLKSTNGTEIPENVAQIQIIKYERIFNFLISDDGYIDANNDIDNVLSLVSTRNAKFDQMAEDEKLQNINIAIEYMLKEKGKYIKFDYSNVFLGFIEEADVINYRNLTHCFRHADEENINKRNCFSIDQKIFLINYGLTICMSILSNKKGL